MISPLSPNQTTHLQPRRYTLSEMNLVLSRAVFSHFELEDGRLETVMFLYQKPLRSGS